MELVGAAVVLPFDVVEGVLMALDLAVGGVDDADVDVEVVVLAAVELVGVPIEVITGAVVVVDDCAVMLELFAAGAVPPVAASLVHADITMAATASPATPASADFHLLMPIVHPGFLENACKERAPIWHTMTAANARPPTAGPLSR